MKSKDRASDHGLGIFESLSCILKDRFYFAISNGVPPSFLNLHVFSTDDTLVYEKFYDDFGPFNLAQVYRYCRKVNKKLKASALSNNKIVHCTSTEITKRTNAAFLVGCYQIIYLNRSADEAYKHILLDKYRTFAPYRDASSGPSYYDLNLSDCLRAVQKAVRFGFLDFDTFDLEDYEYNEKVENGDLSWIIPNKFIAFSGPHTRTMIDNGYPMHAPEFYLPYFRKNNVTNVIRLNQKMYESHRFTRAGIAHHDLFFPDGTVPTKAITLQFLDICETAPGAIAVHCKAGLGRTGTLIGCYLMKHYHFTAPEAIAWIRICRPGSIIGQQQNWLEEQQAWCWEEGRRERREKSPSPLPSRRRKDLIDADIAANHLSRPIGKVIYINTDPPKSSTQVRDEPVLRFTGLDNGGDASQTPLSATSSTNDQVEVLITSRPRVYHHKVQIAGRSQSPPAYGTCGEELNDSIEPRYSPGPSREINGARMSLCMASSRSMDLSPKPSTYKSTFTQGDQLNRIKVIRKRNKQRKNDADEDINIPSTTQQLASSYPRIDLSGSVGEESGSALDFREIYNLHDEVTEDGSTTLESSDVEAYNRFRYEPGDSQLPSMFYHNVTSSPPNGSKDRVEIQNGDSIDIQPSMTATLSSRDSLSSSYPRTLTPVNLPPTAVAARTPSESNVRPLRGRGITTRGCENHRETDNGGTGGAGFNGNNVGMGLPRTGITSTLPVSASRVPHQNSRMPTVIRAPPQKVPGNRDGHALLCVNYPEGPESSSPSSIATSTTVAAAAGVGARKRVDFAPPPPPPPPPPPLPILLTSNSLPTSKIRSTSDTFYQRLYHSNSNGKNVTNITNNEVDEKDYYLRPYRNLRSHNNGDVTVIKYNSSNAHATNGRNSGSRGPSPSPLLSPNQVGRHHVRSSSVKPHAQPISSSPVVYADIQTNSPPEFDYRPRASSMGPRLPDNYRQSFNE
ncbi:hypothetical protein TcWFU_001264 [Taenia crassiceps]|uniref:protein-tyrosine-phosphatase n=1 Tax=Taenia crassiceps TaxID=6207 RepID=A0ABR4Q5G2_9CEST